MMALAITLGLWVLGHGRASATPELSDELLQLSRAYRQRPNDPRVRLQLAQGLQRVEPLQRVLAAPCPEVMALGFGTEGISVLAVCRNGQLLVWGQAGQVPNSQRLPGGPYLAAHFSEDAATLQLLRRDGVLLTWELRAAREIRQIRLGRKGLRCAAFRADGRRLLTCGTEGAEIFNSETGQRVSQLKQAAGEVAPPTIVDGWWSSTSEQIVLVDASGALMLWHPPYEHLGHFVARPEQPERLVVQVGLEESRRARVLAGDPPRRVWTGLVGDPWARISPAPLWIRRSAPSANGNLIAVANPDGQVEIFMRDSGAGLAVLGGHPGTVLALRFHPSAAALATAGRDGSVRLWQLTAGARLRSLSHPDGPVTSAAFSADGAQVLTQVEDGPTRIWDVATGQAVTAIAARGGALALWANRPGVFTHLVCGLPFRQLCKPDDPQQGSSRPYDPTDLTQWLLWWISPAGVDVAARSSVSAPVDLVLNPSADGQSLVLSTGRDAPGSWLRNWRGQTSGQGRAPGQYLLVSTGKAPAELWDIDRNRRLSTVPGLRTKVRNAAMSSGATRLAILPEGAPPLVLDLASGRSVELAITAREDLQSVAISTDGRWVAAAGTSSEANRLGRVRLWDAEEGVALAAWDGEGRANTVQFAPRGLHLVTAHQGGLAQIWDFAGESRSAETIDALLRCRLPFFHRATGPKAGIPPSDLCLKHPEPGRPFLDTQRALWISESAGLRHMRQATEFQVGAVGAGGTPVSAWYALQALLVRPQHNAPLLRQIFQHSATEVAGKLYALCGLRAVSDPALASYARTLQSSTTAIRVMPGGCRGLGDLPAGQLASLIANPEGNRSMADSLGPDPDFWRNLCKPPEPNAP